MLIPLLLVAQINDNFDDGDFSHNPTWSGTNDVFIVDNFMLKLNDDKAGSAFLSTPCATTTATQWEFWTRLAFTPSTKNHPCIYLMSDQQDLSNPLNGYYIRIGKDGTDNKRLFFCRQTGEEHREIMVGSTNLASQSNNFLRIKVTRDEWGNWEFFADASGGEFYSPQGSVHDTTHTAGQWFGIRCNYTISNASRFYFDDIYMGDILIDTLAPAVKQVLVSSQNTIEVSFTEAVNPDQAQNTSYYQINKEIGEALSAVIKDGDPEKVVLTFAGEFIPGENYQLTISNIKDLAGNEMETFTGNFYWYVPQKFDVVFNELMVNPNPPVGLPPYEYIELFNTSTFEIDMQGWTLQHGSTQRQLPASKIPAGGYLVLTHEAALEDLQHYVNVVAVPGLSATALVNAANALMLWDEQMALIAFVTYTDQWYRNSTKADGGWSLEKIDPYNWCEKENNWTASTHSKGGSPGEANSVLGENTDVTPPFIVRAGYEAANRISIFFSEPIDPFTLVDTDNFIIDQNVGQPDSILLYPPEYIRADLILNQQILPGISYYISACSSITDCAGNPLAEQSIRTGMPQEADSLDMVINEILFNPPETGVRYIEIYNRSDKIIDLQHYILATLDTLENILTGVQEISTCSFLFFPGEYLVLSPDATAVKTLYMTNNPEGFINTSLPPMTNTEGLIVLAGKNHQQNDRVWYHEDMHYALLANKKGVSLERLHYNRCSREPSNWHSASTTSGYGTPGYINSQFSLYTDQAEDVFGLSPLVFSPDNDGVDDMLQITWHMSQAGFTANISVYDSRGRLIRTLRRSELLAMQGTITWDGITDDSQKADMGIYIIFIELFEPSGTVKTFKKTAVLAGKL